MPERAEPIECDCGLGVIEWRPYPPIPFPEVATPSQLAKQAKGGRWVHVRPDGGYDEWCPPRSPRPRPDNSGAVIPAEPDAAESDQVGPEEGA